MASSENSKRTWITVVGLLLAVILLSWFARRLLTSPPVPAPVSVPPVPEAPATAPAVPLIVTPTLKTPEPKKIVPVKKLAPPPIKKPMPSPPAPVVTPPTPVQPPPVYIPPPAEEPQEWKGNDTSVTHVGQVVLHNDHQWVHFWSEHHPHEAAPDVDFEKNMVVGVFAGPRPAEQFTIRIVEVRTTPSSLVVDYAERLPPPGTFAVNVTVYPYFIKVFPRSTLPVKFNALPPENVQR